MTEVVFIAGAPRSGSTLLDRLLGEVEGFISLGEAGFIWERGFIENQMCGCNESFYSCSFWSKVINSYLREASLSAEQVYNIQRQVSRNRYIPQLLYPGLRSASFQERLELYQQHLARLYEAVLSEADGNVIVDSTKIPHHGFLLSQMPGIRLYVIHLLRDVRAVAYSWKRKKAIPVRKGTVRYMDRYSLPYTLWLWASWNALSMYLRRCADVYIPVSYEQLALEPRRVLSKILRQMGKPNKLDFFVDENHAWLGVAHTVGGNPMRFHQGILAIHPDDEWQEKMPRWQRTLLGSISYCFRPRGI